MADRPDFAFAHLSDIHFRAGRSGDVHDDEADLRNELEMDLRASGSMVPRIDAVLVSGDIAYGGDPTEYGFAQAWLRRIAEQVSCPSGGILTTPGNHDVDRNLLLDGCAALEMHDAIQNAASGAERDNLLKEYLRDAVKGEQLFAPLQAYNTFATAYGCGVTAQQPYWEKPFPLSDGSELVIRGISTTLVSGPRDKTRPQNLAYGSAQKTFLRTPGQRRVLVGHHPPSWTFDGEDAAQAFGLRNILQLFGHRHKSWITQEGNSLRIVAGAVHPDAREPQWEPRYNLVTVTIESPTELRVRVFPRKWSSEEMIFVADRLGNGSEVRERVLAIEKHERPLVAQVPQTIRATATAWASLAERLRDLGHDVCRTMAGDLGLFVENDGQPLTFVASAVATGKLSELEAKLVEKEAQNTEDSERDES